MQIVTLSEAKGLVASSEIPRFARNDKNKLESLSCIKR